MTTQPIPRRRSVITGQGLVTPLGRTTAEVWNRWAAGRPAAGPTTKGDYTYFGITQAAEVPDFDPRKEVKNRKLLRLMIGGEIFGMVAATAAFDDAGLTADDYAPERGGVCVSCHKEGFRDANLYDALGVAVREDGSIDRELLIEDGIRRIPPQTLVEGLPNAALYYFANQFVLQGFNQNFIASCTGGSLAVGAAMRAVRNDEADVVLSGSFDTWMDWRCIGEHQHVGVLSRSDEPAHAVQKPFDRHRTGGIAGEGAGMLILEDHERAWDRNATILGEVSGFAAGTAVSGDDNRDARLYGRVIRRAIEDAGLAPEQVDVIHLHGEASVRGDRIEAAAVRAAFQDAAATIPATTIKSTTGLLGNASGAVELLLTLEMLNRGEILPIVNLQSPDPQFGLNFVQTPLTGLDLQHGLVLQHSWSGHFTALIVSRFRNGS